MTYIGQLNQQNMYWYVNVNTYFNVGPQKTYMLREVFEESRVAGLGYNAPQLLDQLVRCNKLATVDAQQGQ